MRTGKLTIGAVTFRRKHKKLGKPNWRGKRYWIRDDAELMGAERVAALRAFFRGERIPGDLVPCADWHNGSDDIQWDDVHWETAGAEVTG